MAEAASATKVSVRVRTWLNNTLDFELTPSQLVGEIKDAILKKIGTAVAEQLLRYGSVPLCDCWAVSKLIPPGSTQLILRLTLRKAAVRRMVTRVVPMLHERLSQAVSSSQILVFDFDDTLATKGLIAPEMAASLRGLKEMGHFLSIASFNRSVVELLRLSEVHDLFDVIVGGFNVGITKADTVLSVLGHYNYESSPTFRVVFFDDKPVNVLDVNHGFHARGWNNTDCIQVNCADHCLILLAAMFPEESSRPSSSSTTSTASPPTTSVGPRPKNATLNLKGTPPKLRNGRVSPALSPSKSDSGATVVHLRVRTNVTKGDVTMSTSLNSKPIQTGSGRRAPSSRLLSQLPPLKHHSRLG